MINKKSIIKILYIITLLFASALIWILLFNPILHFFNAKEEAYIPYIEGMNEKEAIRILYEKGFDYRVEYISYQEGVTPFTIFSTYPRYPRKVNKNRPIELTIYKDKVEVEAWNYIGLTVNQAKKNAKKNKLNFDDKNILYYYDENDPVNLISRQYPVEGALVLESSPISFWVCNGKPPNEYIVPNVIGMGVNEAMKELKINGFLIGDISYIIKNNFLENTVYELSYISNEGYNVEVLEGVKYTVPITLNIVLTKYEE